MLGRTGLFFVAARFDHQSGGTQNMAAYEMRRPVRRESFGSQRSEFGCIPAAIIRETVKASHTFVHIVKHNIIEKDSPRYPVLIWLSGRRTKPTRLL